MITTMSTLRTMTKTMMTMSMSTLT